MRTIVTVVGPDRVGIIAETCSLLASMNVNILDIRQSVMEGIFTMTMLADTALCTAPFDDVRQALISNGEATGLSIHIQREDTFTAMYQI